MINRKSIRIREYDYSKDGLYFITICTNKRSCLFGKVENDIIMLNDAGRMIDDEWKNIPILFPNVQLHDYVIMPNHFHSIIHITNPVESANVPNFNGQPQGIAPTAAPVSIGRLVGAFKSITTVRYIEGIRQHGWTKFNNRLWQHNYWERVIRRDKTYLYLAQYIKNNPAVWTKDKLHQT